MDGEGDGEEETDNGTRKKEERVWGEEVGKQEMRTPCQVAEK